MSGVVAGALSRLGGAKSRGRASAGGLLNAAGRAGPRRPVIIVLSAVAVLGTVITVARTGQPRPIVSRDAQLMNLDPLPGGLHSTPEQNALALVSNDALASDALRRGTSFTPPMAPSQSLQSAPVTSPARLAAVRRAPRYVAHPYHPIVEAAMMPAVFREPAPAPEPAPSHEAPLEDETISVSTTAQDSQLQQAYSRHIGDLFSQWGSRAPRTDVVLTPQSAADPAGDTPAAGAGSDSAGARGTASAVRSPDQQADAGDILIPAGRGIYAHPILALSSDESSPVILQADSGPIAGDRMIGTFSREDDRLVIHINSIIHNGEAIGADGVVIAPDTMEAAVASNVDQHYLTRFILPAAAAFVSGLGQALATTSNTAAVLSPFGGVSTSTNLNLHQQLGVAAGTAAAQIGSTLAAAAPKGPTVSLEANVAIGVMFLSNVTSHARR